MLHYTLGWFVFQFVSATVQKINTRFSETSQPLIKNNVTKIKLTILFLLINNIKTVFNSFIDENEQCQEIF